MSTKHVVIIEGIFPELKGGKSQANGVGEGSTRRVAAMRAMGDFVGKASGLRPTMASATISFLKRVEAVNEK